MRAHQLKPANGAVKKKKRVGRGNSSGHGTYSTRGLKGQKSRSGVSGLKRLGMRQVLLRTPKQRGFKSAYIKSQIVNLSLLNGYFKDNDSITPETLLSKKLVKTTKNNIKILADGQLKLKNLRFKGVKFSASAWDKIKDSGAVLEK
ncbi:MAG TPA: 50S ribosomal protein L15 [bacterium]|nr:50S ribosomal protein L15 [bacterium]